MDNENIVFHDAKESPFKLYGFYEPYTYGEYLRVPHEVADNVNEGVKGSATNSSGCRLRFKTNATNIGVKIKFKHPITEGGTAACTIRCGIDVYEKINNFYIFRCLLKRLDNEDLAAKDNTMTGYFTLPEGDHELTLNLPAFSTVDSLYIGIPKDAYIAEHSPYAFENPVVFYGSSITHGAAASRPGNMYEAVASRKLDFNYTGLGFSGWARGEDEIIDFIRELKMSVFVLDYDHNAPDAEHLNNTHLRAYKRFREKQPDTPIVLISKPDIKLSSDEDVKRRIIVQKTYHYAIENGDKNVYYLDGYSLFEGDERDNCTLDGCHPTDVGFFRFGTAVANLLRYIFYKY